MPCRQKVVTQKELGGSLQVKAVESDKQVW